MCHVAAIAVVMEEGHAVGGAAVEGKGNLTECHGAGVSDQVLQL